tara:strand:+ start:986 stop:1636 length:651 start_codon:yes stop_codon:yes gene_type:complete
MKNSNFKIPIFPLDGVILLPETLLPLNIFEKKYLYMVDDSLKTNSRLIGIVQPIMKKKDMIPSFKNIVGCFGKIVKFEETEQNTYLISLKGLSRFNIINSSLGKKGYISSNISTENFQNDLNYINSDKSFKFTDDKRLKTTLKSYLKFKKLDSNWNYIKSCSNIDLINQLSMICPFSVHEKQMLLESNTIDERYILLVSILQSTLNPNEKQNEIKH